MGKSSGIKGPDEFFTEFIEVHESIPPPHEVHAELHQKFIDDGERIKKNIEQFPAILTKSLVDGGHDIVFGLTNAPLDFFEDTTKALVTFLDKPVDVLETVVRTPAHLLNNLTEVVDVALKDSIDMKSGSYEDRATKARTVTDFIPFI